MAQGHQSQPPVPAATWQSRSVFILAGVFFVVGLIAGYLLPGDVADSANTAAAVAPKTPGVHPPLTVDQMKAIADRKAAPLLEKLKSNPTDATLLGQLAALYSAAHQFQQSTDYYSKALQADPNNLKLRTQLASSLYYGGDADAALKQLQQVLESDPKNANALFNLGMMKWRGKNDAAGAIVTWQELLRRNPNLDRKSTVEQMIAEAKAQASGGTPGSTPAP
jgi:cytochrome c-type biogenesis protein CcmH/NrfG